MVESSHGERSSPQASAIRRHATLAGVAPAAWQPLAADPGGAAPAAVLEQHRRAIAQVMAAIAAGEAESTSAVPR
jgi:hypothetical protein